MTEMKRRINDILFLSNAFSEKLLDDSNFPSIADEWKIYADYKGMYDQIRFIDANGDERIRINYSADGSTIVDQAHLQNKKDRYYFTESQKLSAGQILISSIDLNIENGQIEEPIKPMVRFSTPIFDKNGNFYGIIITNYLADVILGEFSHIANYSDGEVFLLNSESYWISSDDPELNWAFMYDDKKDINFKNYYPEEWDEMQQPDHSFTSQKGFFQYKIINADASLKNQQNIDNKALVFTDKLIWIVSYVDLNSPKGDYYKSDFLSKAKRTFQANQSFFVFIFFITLIGGFVLSITQQLYQRTKYLSEHDAFTGAFNRSAGLKLLEKQSKLNDRRRIKFCLCFLDINGLKAVNDTLGHDVGDELILTVVDILKRSIRANDYIIRLGGDEFVITFCNITILEAEDIWRRILNEVDNVNQTEKRPYLISVSHGIVEYKPDIEANIDAWIMKADKKMYSEKKGKKKGEIIIRKSK